MAAGAAGFFSHSEPPERLLDGAADVAAGRMVFPYLDVRALHDPLRALTGEDFRTQDMRLRIVAVGREAEGQRRARVPVPDLDRVDRVPVAALIRFEQEVDRRAGGARGLCTAPGLAVPAALRVRRQVQ